MTLPAPPAPVVFEGAWSTWQIEKWLDQVEAEPGWVALMDDDPFSVADPLTVEIVGGTYARGPVVWSRPGPRLLRVGNQTTWLGLPPSSVVLSVAVFDAPVNGNMLFAVYLSEAVPAQPGGLIIVPADTVYAGLDV